MIDVDFNEIAETAEERLEEAFSSKAVMKIVKGRTGLRYATVAFDATQGLREEYWYNLDPIDGDADCPRLRFGLKITDQGTFYVYKDEKFGAMERPRIKSTDWWRRLASKDVTWLNKQFRDWLASPAGRSFVEKNKLDGCLCVKNWLESVDKRRP